MSEPNPQSERSREVPPVEGVVPQPEQFVDAAKVLRAFAGAPPIDSELLRHDLGRSVDQEPTPRT